MTDDKDFRWPDEARDRFHTLWSADDDGPAPDVKYPPVRLWAGQR